MKKAGRPDTRGQLLDAAETLFAARGFSGVSLREVVKAAGVNAAAAHYHFGSKEKLFEEVFARRAAPVVQLTRQMLDAASEWREHRNYVEQIVKALIGPSIQGASGDSAIARNYGRLRAHIFIEDRAFARRLFRKNYADIGRRSVQMLSEALPELSERDVAWRFHIVIATLVFSCIPAGRVHTPFGVGIYNPQDPSEAISFLVPVLAAMFRSESETASRRRGDVRVGRLKVSGG